MIEGTAAGVEYIAFRVHGVCMPFPPGDWFRCRPDVLSLRQDMTQNNLTTGSASDR
jgi:hypothetical protein